MAEHPRAESPRYMEIKFKPQHSKWLQRSISDVNVRLKAIWKLVEEDADSFARRAEMYFKNRPRLMELVEELYQAYHTLAEQYNQATRALHQTHHTVVETFSSKLVTPKISDMTELDTLLKDATIIFISDMDAKLKTTIKLLEEVADSFAKRAEMYYKHRPKLKKLVEEFYQAYCSLAEQYDTVANVLRRVLHTISDAFLKETPTPLSELDAHEHELQSDDQSRISHNNNNNNKNNKNAAVKRSATFPEEKWLAETSHLTKEIDNLKEEILLENNRADKAESEVATLKASIRQLSVESDAAKAECQAYREKIESLEAELVKAQNDINVLADGWSKEVRNLQSTDKVKQSQKQELDDLKHKLRELEARQLEPERINRSKQKEEEEMMKVAELMEELERSKMQAEKIIWELEKEIERLNERNVSSEILLSELENKTVLLADTNERLENEVEILRERLWMYFGKQEKLVFAATLNSGADMKTSLNSSNWLSVFFNRIYRVLLPLKSNIGAFLFSLVKVVVYVYTRFFTAQSSSEKIIKEDDQCKKKLMQKVEKHRLYKMRDEMDENEKMSDEDDWRNSKTILEDYKEET